MGVSFGGLMALQNIIPLLSSDFPVPVIIVQHHDPRADDFLAKHLDGLSGLKVKMAEEKEPVLPGMVYIAPANYHLLVEDDRSFSLSVEAKVNFARPSIDVLFESATDVYGARLVGVILTGANQDGSRGLARIKALGGIAVVQDPTSAEAPIMPEAALAATEVDYVLMLDEIAPFLNMLCNEQKAAECLAGRDDELQK
jgi:two-component system chemotaxis response regulator CheB